MNTIKSLFYQPFVGLLVVLTMMCSNVWADNVSTPEGLNNVLKGSILSGNIVTLTEDVALSSTLTIQGGDMVLNLAGRTISITKNKAESKCISVNGGVLTILGGGTMFAQTTGTQLFDNQNAIALSCDAGEVRIHNATFKAEASDGTSYSLDPNGKINNVNRKVSDLIPYGAYMTNSSDYSSEGLVASSTTVALTTYNVSYNNNAGTITTPGTYSYTIETTTFELPVIDKTGYNLVQWEYDNKQVDVAKLPTTTDRVATTDLTFAAKWQLIQYNIVYDVKGGEAINPAFYNIESKIIALPIPTRSGYRFLGWYETEDFSSNVVENIPQGSIGDKTFYARWTKIYKIEYDLNGGQNIVNPPTEYITEEATILPKKPTFANSLFKGWYTNPELTGSPVTTIEKNDTGDKKYFAKWLTSYTMSFDTNGGDVLAPINYAKGDTKTLNIPRRNGYTFVNWYEDATLTKEYGKSINPQSSGNITLYAKWTPTPYNIIYYTYNGSNPSNAPTKYTIESESVTLPVPQRERYTFAGWCETDDLSNTNYKSQIAKGNYGDKTFYARWTAGSALTIVQPENGSIVVKNGTTTVNSGDRVGEKVPIVITATPTVEGCKLTKLLIGGVPYTTSPQDTVMPKEGLFITAEFTDTRPGIKSPRITTLPENTDYIPVGTDVKVAMQNQEAGSELFYSLDGTTPKKYTEPFLVSSATAKTVKVSAIARKAGYKDGITTRDIKFGSGKITISFNLPKGITATNPLGGEVVSAVASGGTFQFKLNVDEDYFETLDSIRAEANGTILKADAYGVYTLSEQKANVTVKVTGITGVTYTITLTQTPNGHVSFTDQDTSFVCIVNRGDRVSIKAEADEDYKFVSWSDGNQSNPREIVAESNMNLQTRFVTDADHYMVVFPEMEGVTVKTLTNYSQEVKRGGTCKFYLRLDADYDQSVPVVKANGEVLTVNKEVYSLYNIKNNYSISVSGIQKNKIKVEATDNVIVTNVETMADATKMDLLPEAVVNMYAKVPVGKVFLKWNDGKADNPRISTAQDASQLLPLFTTSASGETFGKVVFTTPVGAGISAINANADAVKAGGDLQFKVVVLPQYSRSKVKVTANDKEIQSELELRASTETTSFIYTLKGVAGETKINVSGLVLNDYTLVIEQKAGGTIHANQSGSLKYGTGVTLSATPASGNMFVKWSDGNTLNPYPYKIIGDMTMNAVFIQSNSPVDNEIKPSLGRIYIVENTLHIDVDKPMSLYIWNYNGQLVQNTYIQAGHSTFHLSQGNYIIKTATNPPLKILVR